MLLFIFYACEHIFYSQKPSRHDTTRHDTTRHDTTRHDMTRHDKGAWPLPTSDLRLPSSCNFQYLLQSFGLGAERRHRQSVPSLLHKRAATSSLLTRQHRSSSVCATSSLLTRQHCSSSDPVPLGETRWRIAAQKDSRGCMVKKLC